MAPKSRLFTRFWGRRSVSSSLALPNPENVKDRRQSRNQKNSLPSSSSAPEALCFQSSDTSDCSHSQTEASFSEESRSSVEVELRPTTLQGLQERLIKGGATRLCVSADDDSEAEQTSGKLMFHKLRKTISSDSIFSQASREQLPERPVKLTPEQKAQTIPEEIKSPLNGSVSSHGSAEKSDLLYDVKIQSKKNKYFSEKSTTKNIFKKLLHPSYYERRMQFRKLFGDIVDEADLFLTSYSCAYHREILAHGRMYLTQRRVCFYANIFGWETSLIIPINEIVCITKERAAKIFPNSLQIEKKSGEKYFFASFANRDKSYGVLQAVHTRIQEGDSISPEQLWEMLKLEHHHDLSPAKSHSSASDKRFFDSAPSTPLTNDSAMPSPIKREPLSPSSASRSDCLHLSNNEFTAAHETSSHSSLEDYLNETECSCRDHSGKLCLDAVYPFSTEELYDMMFNDSNWFMNKYLLHVKHNDYKSTKWTKSSDFGEEHRTTTYSVPLNQSLGPKSCQITEKQILKYVVSLKAGFTMQKESQNSGVPYSDAFVIDTTYCVTRISRNECRIKVHCGVRFKKPPFSFIRNLIDRTSMSGIDEHYATLEKLLNEEALQRRMISGMDRTRKTEEPEVIPGGEGSSASSLEDVRQNMVPTTLKSHTLPMTKKSPVAMHHPSTLSLRHRRRHQNLNDGLRKDSMVASIDLQSQTQPDYGGYIRVIIGLLFGLLLLNLMLLIRMHLDDQSKRFMDNSVWPHNASAQLEYLLSSVAQLQQHIQELHHSVRELQVARRDEL